MNNRTKLLAAILALISLAAYFSTTAPRVVPDPSCRVNPHTGIPSMTKVGSLARVYMCANNSTACDEPARVALGKVDPKWGPFDFFCFEGRVSQIYSPLESPISKDHMAFINENPELFGLKTGFSVTLTSGTQGEQIYRGLRVAAGVWPSKNEQAGWYRDENWSELMVMLSDSSHWRFDPAPKIDKDAALNLAKAYWEPVRPPQISEWRTEAVYGIRAGLPKDSDCPREPMGAWFIRGSGHWNPPGGGNTNSRHMNAIVDGKTGKVCSYYGRNGSDRRGNGEASN